MMQKLYISQSIRGHAVYYDAKVLYIYETKEAQPIFYTRHFKIHSAHLWVVLCIFATLWIDWVKSERVIFTFYLLWKPEEPLELMWSWYSFSCQTCLNFFIFFLYTAEMSPSPMTFMKTRNCNQNRCTIEQISLKIFLIRSNIGVGKGHWIDHA